MKSDWQKQKKALLLAISMTTIFPVSSDWEEEVGKRAPVYFPLAGALIGAVWSLCLLLLRLIQAPVQIGAALLTACPLVCSGLLHWDGYLDCCDALLSHRDRDGKRKILKDPVCGPFAVAGGIFAILLLFAAFSDLWQTQISLWEPLLESIAVRGLMSWAVQHYHPFSEQGFAAFFHSGNRRDGGWGLLTALFCGAGMTLLGGKPLFAYLGACAAFRLALDAANRRLEGVNGDCFGWGAIWFEGIFWTLRALTGGI